MAQDNASIARQIYDDWNAREFERIADQAADDGEIVIVGSGTRFTGREGWMQYSRSWADAFPDSRVQVDNVIPAGDTVVVEFTGRGTHTGTFSTPAGDIPATGRSVTLQACDVLEFTDEGKIRSQRTYFDSGALLAQLGITADAGMAAQAP